MKPLVKQKDPRVRPGIQKRPEHPASRSCSDTASGLVVLCR